MRNALFVILAALLVGLAACTSFGTAQINVGEPESAILAKLGTPTHRYQVGNDRLLEYKGGPWGQYTYMARIGPDGRLVSYEQVLTTQKFAAISIGKANKDDVLRTIGAPSETSYLSLSDLEVWSYPYKESDVWNSVMHVHFDRNGIVQKMQNGPDLRFDSDRRWPFGFMGL